MNSLVHEFNTIGLSETWLNNSNKNLYNLPMYDSEHFIRENKRGGSVSLMINKLIPYTNRVDLVPNNAHFEAVFVETER